VLDGVQFGSDTGVIYRNLFHDLSGSLELKLNVLLSWVITPDRVAAYRQNFVAHLLRRYIAEHDGGCLDLQDSLVQWIDANQDLDEPTERNRVAALFAELMRTNVFSYSRYLQSLIASGETSVVAPQVCPWCLWNMPDARLTCLVRPARVAASLFAPLLASM
jgi:hypothetical protein